MKNTFFNCLFSSILFVSLAFAQNDCILGEFRCLDNAVQQCTVGNVWITIQTCGAGLRCMPNDYECVPEGLFTTFSSLIGASNPVTATTALCSTSAILVSITSSSSDMSSCSTVTVTVPQTTCDTTVSVASLTPTNTEICTPNQFRCSIDSAGLSIVQQCEVTGLWITIANCGAEMLCMDGDFECAPKPVSNECTENA